jgi:hypothetical protein
MASAKNAFAGSGLKFSNGRTAIRGLPDAGGEVRHAW